MKDNHSEHIKDFIKELIRFNPKDLPRAKHIFNPWTTSDITQGDINENAHITRCKNLKNYLSSIKTPDYILIAESPSSGARYTGIAMTSEKVIKENNLSYQSTSQKGNTYELTASRVWNEMSKGSKTFVLWNAFAFNINKKQNKWFENPTSEELKANKYLLEKFLDLYPKAKIVAVGTKAKEALSIIGITNIENVRHPSHDYKKEFKLAHL